MGVSAASVVPGGRTGRRPGYWFLLRGVLPGQIVGTLWLWLIAIALSPFVHFHTGSRSVFAPWQIDSLWSLGAAVGWGVLVSALIGAAVGGRVRAHTGVTPSRVLTLVSVAAGGYGPWLLATTPGGRLVVTALATPALLRGLAFDHSGAARRLPRRVELTRIGLGVAALGTALVLVAPYALLHVAPRAATSPLVVYAGLDTSYITGTDPGRPLQGEAGLTAGLSPITVTAVRLTGTAGAKLALRIGAPPFTSDSPLALPMRIAPRHTLWLGYSVALGRCGGLTATVIRVQVNYVASGISRTQTSPAVHTGMSQICP